MIVCKYGIGHLEIGKGRFCKDWSLHYTNGTGYDKVLATARQKYVLEALIKHEEILLVLVGGHIPLFLA